jgi:iron transport multicopper oxidase
MIHLQ